jgi:iron-sulfur cluster repair protein YtfE (RIC family)
MTTTRPDTTCETHDMVLVHRVFRREFTLAPRLVRATAAGDTSQAAIVAGHIGEMMHMLHHHHTAEDELLWPRLLERARLDRDVIELMEAQHAAIAELLAAIDDSMRSWVQTADPEAREKLATRLDPLPAALTEHLQAEEDHVLPIVERTITAAEWRQLAERGMAALPRARMLVFLGRIFEEADVDERREFLRHIPAPARVAYRLSGRRRYDRETTRQRRDLEHGDELIT